MKPTIQSDVRRITIFISDILGSPSKGQAWMKRPRPEWKFKNAIEMISDDQLDSVMLMIHQEMSQRPRHIHG